MVATLLGRLTPPMRCMWLVWAGLARDPLRTALTAGCVTVAFALLWLLKGIDSGLSRMVEAIPDHRLHVASRAPASVFLPLAHVGVLEDVPGVVGVAHYRYFAGRHGNSKSSVNILAVDIKRYLDVLDEVDVDPATVDLFGRTPGAAIAGSSLIERYGWQVGDRIVLDSVGDSVSGWSFELVGTWEFDSFSPHEAEDLIVDHTHVDQTLPEGQAGLVVRFEVEVDDVDRAGTISAEIDRRFRNSSAPTLTVATRDAVATGRHPAQVRLVANGIVGAAFFAILLCTAGTMAQSVRDRHVEMATMKALGFSTGMLIFGVTGESLMICACGALLALAPAAIVDGGALAGRFGAFVYPPAPSLYVGGFGILLLLAVLSVALPSWRLFRLSPSVAR